MNDLYEFSSIFNLDNRIADTSNLLYSYNKVDINQIPYPNVDINFILNNILDDQFILEESFYPLITEDVKTKIKFLKNFSLSNNIVIVVLGVLLYAGIFQEEIKFTKVKLRFCEAISRIKEEELENPIRDVEKFYNNSEN